MPFVCRLGPILCVAATLSLPYLCLDSDTTCGTITLTLLWAGAAHRGFRYSNRDRVFHHPIMSQSSLLTPPPKSITETRGRALARSDLHFDTL